MVVTIKGPGSDPGMAADSCKLRSPSCANGPCITRRKRLVANFSVSELRQRWRPFDTAVQYTPVLLMKDGVILHDALRANRVAEEDLMAKLREANATDLTSVRAVAPYTRAYATHSRIRS